MWTKVIHVSLHIALPNSTIRDEALVIMNPVFEQTFKISEKMCEAPEAARKSIDRALMRQEATTSDLTLQTLAQRRASLLVTDTEFYFEIALLQALCGQGSEQRLVMAVKKQLPDAEKAVSFETAVQRVTAMKTQPVFTMASRTAQARVATILRILAKYCDGEVPDLSVLAGDATMQPLVAQLAYFVRHHVDDKDHRCQCVVL